jgi:hypothetical protein
MRRSDAHSNDEALAGWLLAVDRPACDHLLSAIYPRAVYPHSGG